MVAQKEAAARAEEELVAAVEAAAWGEEATVSGALEVVKMEEAAMEGAHMAVAVMAGEMWAVAERAKAPAAEDVPVGVELVEAPQAAAAWEEAGMAQGSTALGEAVATGGRPVVEMVAEGSEAVAMAAAALVRGEEGAKARAGVEVVITGREVETAGLRVAATAQEWPERAGGADMGQG